MLYWVGQSGECLNITGKIIRPLVDPEVPHPDSMIPKGALSDDVIKKWKKEKRVVSLKGDPYEAKKAADAAAAEEEKERKAIEREQRAAEAQENMRRRQAKAAAAEKEADDKRKAEATIDAEKQEKIREKMEAEAKANNAKVESKANK